MDLEHAFDLDGGVEGQFGDADRGARMAARSPRAATIRSEAPFITGASCGEGGHGVDEAAEADAAHDLVEIADRGAEPARAG